MSDPSFKLVVAWSDSRNLCSIIRDALSEVAPGAEMLALGDDATVVHALEEASVIRDRLRERLDEGDHVFVVEFEKWSGYSAALEARWLLARGH